MLGVDLIVIVALLAVVISRRRWVSTASERSGDAATGGVVIGLTTGGATIGVAAAGEDRDLLRGPYDSSGASASMR